MGDNVLVTGSSGFVGTAVRAALERRAIDMRPARPHVAGQHRTAEDWRGQLEGISAVVHLGARVHVMKDRSADPLAEFRRDNVHATSELAKAAARAGARRFVFVSSVKVNGEETTTAPFTELDLPAPTDPYGISKLEAEDALREVSQETGMEVVILRPPLIYGPGVKANFLRLMTLVERGIPLPFAITQNARSLLGVDNLADAIVKLAVRRESSQGTYLISDRHPLSTGELVRCLAEALGVPARLLPVPSALMLGLGTAIGKRAVVRRLVGSLVVDSRKLTNETGWTPLLSIQEQLARTVDWYRNRQSTR